MNDSSPEATFYMKPVALIEHLARTFVREQRQIADLRKKVDALPADTPAAAVAEIRAQIDTLCAQWVDLEVPNLAATFRLALEVLDTHGPNGVNVEDPMDAAISNNKHSVWLREFGGVLPEEGD